MQVAEQQQNCSTVTETEIGDSSEQLFPSTEQHPLGLVCAMEAEASDSDRQQRHPIPVCDIKVEMTEDSVKQHLPTIIQQHLNSTICDMESRREMTINNILLIHSSVVLVHCVTWRQRPEMTLNSILLIHSSIVLVPLFDMEAETRGDNEQHPLSKQQHRPAGKILSDNLAVWGEVTHRAILIKCCMWTDMVDIITCAIFGDCRIRGVGVVTGVILPSPIDLRCRPYNTGH